MAKADSASSSMTSTSHTMTALSNPVVNSFFSSSKSSASTTAMPNILQVLAEDRRYAPLSPTICTAGLDLAKGILESFASDLGEEQLQRQKEMRKKRKRGEKDQGEEPTLKIRKLHTNGFEVGQVWEQARRVIEALVEDTQVTCQQLGLNLTDDANEQLVDASSEEEDIEIGSDENLDLEGDGGDISDDEELEHNGELSGEVDGEEEAFDEEQNNFDDEDDSDEEEVPVGVFIEDPHGLNDGFFSIDDFNKQTEYLERQDATADPYTGEASDEEDIDWEQDPTTIPMKAVSSSKRAAAVDEIEGEDGDSSDEDGPTFGNANLNAPEVASDDDEEDADMDDIDEPGDNTNEVLYKDFFEPPPRKASKKELQADYLARIARKAQAKNPEDEAAEIERAQAATHRDLFDDMSDKDDSDDALSELDPADPKSRRSAHERRQAKTLEEIRRLEAMSVAKRDWTLSGEARAADRPLDSLIHEELDFEHVGKTVPEVTAEVNEEIEDLIRRRILAKEFDEVLRRRPDSLSTPANTRRGAFELDDSKPKQSLAEMYEEEHVKNNNPDTYVSKADEKVRQAETEIEGLWKEAGAKLDALSSWSYKPKPAAPSLAIVSDVATISMEDAQPTTAAGVSGGESMLAPQEIYKAGKEKDSIEKGEVVPKSGAPVARQEMTREEKLRRRRREKERIKKRGGDELNQRVQGKKKQANREMLGELKKGGVKIIDRKGNVRNVDGEKIQASAAPKGAGGFKL
ncbi:U3 small nucleolar ribonucleoprotein complex, subunit Mpp10 [Calycina marina]|uniref:U3 small nucleolar ribonucleoprotein protein MPP10 n=1 Tax=Calycina marina TaxID=1763456 RepID=A0A9P8CF13_9HELO|nr:U3 small nucleolar ribonucleoprotein complex, subunit Mpp10 [Calycina marina]